MKPNPFKDVIKSLKIDGAGHDQHSITLKPYSPPPVTIKEAFAFSRGDLSIFANILWEAALKYNINVVENPIAVKRRDFFNWKLTHEEWSGGVIFRISNDSFGEQIRCLCQRTSGSEITYKSEFIHYISDKILPHPSMIIRECPGRKNIDKFQIDDEEIDDSNNICEVLIDPINLQPTTILKK